MARPTVSIAMTTCNGGRFIAEQLASFAAQTVPPDELVVCDDASNDDTLAITEAFAAQCGFAVRIERNQPRLGLHRNFARAISLCSGDVVFISDQDDAWYPAKIARVMEHFAANPGVLAIHHDEHIVDQATGTRLPATLLENYAAAAQWSEIPAVGNCTALRRELVDVLLPFPDQDFYDWWINAVPDALGVRAMLAEPLQFWRRHGRNESAPMVAGEMPSRLAVAWQHGRVDPRPGWQRSAEQLALVHERIAQRAGAIDRLIGEGSAARALVRLEGKIAAIKARIAITSLPRWRRVIAVPLLLARGGYAPFNGWRSAAKDAVWP